MDLYCVSCGEPWSVDHVLHEEPEAFSRRGGLIESCPCCVGKTLEVKSAAEQEWLFALRAIAETTGDDVDGCAAMMEDFHLIELRRNAKPAVKEEWPIIFAYTRAQAIADGVLVDVSKLAQEAGFKYPVALTAAAWADCVAVPPGTDDQDETGRLWDVLNVLRFTIQAARGGDSSSELPFTVSVVTAPGQSEDIALKSLCGPGDDAEPVITIMLPHED